MSKLPREFYLREDVIQISKDLLGKFLFTRINGKTTAGMIVETEAYMAPDDKASHAYGSRRTPRTEPFYKDGGISYVYLCYGIHYLFNIVTNYKNIPHAILIRAIEPKEGTETMLKRRRKTRVSYGLTAGPGSLSLALGITTKHNGLDLAGDMIWLEDKGIVIPEKEIIKSPRVGVAYAEEYAAKPWRFRIKDNPWTSKAK
ncbi:MAG: DNA-3-methyladenine glycosylase [Cytophagaceae bacterium]|nr:DNA-3-methyladenine glycosylase [Cytophagaceae bacterium]